MDYEGITDFKRRFRRLNLYFWELHPHESDEIHFSGTVLGCRGLVQVLEFVVSVGSKGFRIELPGMTEADACWWRFARSLVIRYDADCDEKMVINWERGSDLVEFMVSEGALAGWKKVLGEVEEGRGDDCREVVYLGVSGELWYWPCLGHERKARDPDLMFGEG